MIALFWFHEIRLQKKVRFGCEFDFSRSVVLGSEQFTIDQKDDCIEFVNDDDSRDLVDFEATERRTCATFILDE